MRQNMNKNNNEEFSIHENYHLKFMHYTMIQNSESKKFKIKNISFESEINAALYQISKILQRNSIEIAYVDSSKLL